MTGTVRPPHPEGQAQVAALLDAHDGLRRQLAIIRAALQAGSPENAEAGSDLPWHSLLRRATDLRTFCDQYCHAVHVHHNIEDRRLFPALRRQDPSLGPALERLQADHRDLAVLLDDLQSAVDGDLDRSTTRASLERLAELLEAHLRREEQTVIPALSRLTAWV